MFVATAPILGTTVRPNAARETSPMVRAPGLIDFASRQPDKLAGGR